MPVNFPSPSATAIGRRVHATSSHSTVVTVILVAWTMLTLILGSISLGYDRTYLSQPLHVAIIGLFVMLRIVERRKFDIPAGAFILLLAVALPIISDGTATERFLPEQIKMLMLVGGAAALAPFISWIRVFWIARLFPSVLSAIVAVTWVTGAWDYYGEGRFGVPMFGSPNSTAFVIVIGITFACHIADLRRRFHLYDAALIAFLFVALVRTESDGGMASVLFLVVRYFRVPMKIIVPVAFALIGVAVLTIFLFSIELPELLGSGRLFIWQTLIGNLLNADVVRLLFGFGPGAVDLEPGFTASVLSAHSMFLEVTYSYGLCGLAAMSYAVIATGIRLNAAPLGPMQRRFLEGLYLAFLAGAFVDAYFVTAQLVWLGSLMLSCFALIAPNTQISAAERPGSEGHTPNWGRVSR